MLAVCAVLSVPCCAVLCCSTSLPVQLLQGVFSALGGLGQPPAAAGAAAGAAGQPAPGPEPVHLLQSIASFLQQLQSGAGAAGGDTAMPVTSLALGGTTGGCELCML